MRIIRAGRYWQDEADQKNHRHRQQQSQDAATIWQGQSDSSNRHDQRSISRAACLTRGMASSSNCNASPASVPDRGDHFPESKCDTGSGDRWAAKRSLVPNAIETSRERDRQARFERRGHGTAHPHQKGQTRVGPDVMELSGLAIGLPRQIQRKAPRPETTRALTLGSPTSLGRKVHGDGQVRSDLRQPIAPPARP
jgi:hypothetical protein